MRYQLFPLFVVALFSITTAREGPQSDSFNDVFNYMTSTTTKDSKSVFSRLFNFEEIYGQWMEVYGMLA